MRLRLRSNHGTTTWSSTATTIGGLVHEITGLSDLNPEAAAVLAIKVGFPPKSVEFSNPEVTLQESGVKDGDQLIVEFGKDIGGNSHKLSESSSGLSGDKVPGVSLRSSGKLGSDIYSSTEDVLGTSTATAATDIPSVFIPELNQYLILRNIPHDNSCLFNATSYAVNGADSYKTFSPPSQLREIIISHIRKLPEVYTEAILGRSPGDYCNWITKKDAWGGAIELGILAKWFLIRILCLDIELGHFITFENDKEKPKHAIVLIYSGVHYDLLAVNPELTSTHSASDTTQWMVDSHHETLVKGASLRLCKLLQSRDYVTNTTTFRLRCLDCYKVLVGEVGATKHANDTGHSNFGEVKTVK
jgi:ubiquitin thioesterase OTU1